MLRYKISTKKGLKFVQRKTYCSCKFIIYLQKMEEFGMNEVKKPLLYYYGIVILVVLFFNLLLMPKMFEQQIEEVDYGTFMSMTEEQNIGRVQVEDNQILFSDKDGTVIY